MLQPRAHLYSSGLHPPAPSYEMHPQGFDALPKKVSKQTTCLPFEAATAMVVPMACAIEGR